LIDGHLKAYEWTNQDALGEWDVWNLGTGKGTSVRELISATELVTGKEISIETISRRSIDLAVPISNPEKAKQELQWEARRTLRESIENSYRFLKEKRKVDE
jgi:UDP-glucose 4-epimerase